MANYEIQTIISLFGTFVDSATGTYISPSAITLFVLDPSGAATSYTWPGTITQESVGHFSQQITPTVSGVWTYKWKASGNATATSPDTSFTVNPSLLIAG